MSKDLDQIIENEREWRKHILAKLDKIEIRVEDVSRFKWKATGIMATVIVVANFIFTFMKGH